MARGMRTVSIAFRCTCRPDRLSLREKRILRLVFAKKVLRERLCQIVNTKKCFSAKSRVGV